MPTLTQISEDLVQITITQDEVYESRVDSNLSETSGQVIQDMLTTTLGLEKEKQFWISDIKDAVSASWDENGRYWKYVYKVNDDSDLVF
jgi:hypothetical protein